MVDLSFTSLMGAKDGDKLTPVVGVDAAETAEDFGAKCAAYGNSVDDFLSTIASLTVNSTNPSHPPARVSSNSCTDARLHHRGRGPGRRPARRGG